MAHHGRPGVSACIIGGALAAATVVPQSLRAAEAADAPIVVHGILPDADPNANADAPYKVERSQNDRFTEKLRDTPKTVVVIPKEVIEDLGAQSLREVVRSLPGITLGTGEGGNAFGDRIFIRGFEARNDVYIDGLRDPGVTSREIFAVEQIEVVKGPSGSFGGRGTTGGLVSLELKRPNLEHSFVTAESGVGTDDYRRETIDANYALSGRFAVRVNGLYANADTPGRDYVTNEKWGGAIAAQFKASDRFSISADFYHYRLNGIPDFGLPFDVRTQRPYAVDPDNFYGVIGRDFIRNSADIGTIRLDWNPIDAIKIRSVTRYGRTTNRYVASAPGSVCLVARNASNACPAGGTSVPLPAGLTDVGEANYTLNAGSQRRWGENDYVAHVTEATMQFATGGVGHTLVAGGEYSNEIIKNTPLLLPAYGEDASGNPVATPGSFVRNLLNPDPVLGYTIPLTPDLTTGPSRVAVQTLAAYLIDTLKFSPHVWATVGLRIDAFDLRYRSNSLPTAQRLTSNSTFANWQGSLTWKPGEHSTLYASYATSSDPSGEQFDGSSAAYGGITPTTADLAPEQNQSWEAGAKWESPDGDFLLTGAVFQITKDNAREDVGGGVYQLVGKLRSRGAEISASGTVLKRLQLFGGYTYTDAKIVASATPANVGQPFANIPRHSANLLATVIVTPRLQVGGQVHVQSLIHGGLTAAGTIDRARLRKVRCGPAMEAARVARDPAQRQQPDRQAVLRCDLPLGHAVRLRGARAIRVLHRRGPSLRNIAHPRRLRRG